VHTALSKAIKPPKVIATLKGVRVCFGDIVALDIQHLTFSAGERVFVLGKSGSGKTTLARLLKGRLTPSTGEVRVMGVDPNSPSVSVRQSVQRRVAMIDQEFNLIPRLTAAGNVLSGALGRVSPLKSLLGWYPTHEWEKAEGILGEVELEGMGNRRVDTLSGGQQQRTAIARALMQEASLVLADEPISNLDPELAEDALQLLVSCSDRRDVTLIVNLHQPRLARKFASRVIGLYEGRVVYDGPPGKLSEHEEEFIYLGENNAAALSGVERDIHDHAAETMAN